MNNNINTVTSSYVHKHPVNEEVAPQTIALPTANIPQATGDSLTSTSISKRAITSSPVNPISNIDPKKKHDFKDVVYIWVVQPDSFSQEAETPILNVKGKEFLNNAIVHAKDYNVKILFFDKNTAKEQRHRVSESFVNLQEKLNKENIRITLYDSDKIIDDEVIRKLIMKSKCTGVSVDLLKMYAGANLAKLGIDKALIADFDTELPGSLSIEMTQSDVLPMIEKKTVYYVDYDGFMDHYIENGYCFVKGRSNACFQSMIDRIKHDAENKDCLNVDDVYKAYVCIILSELTGCGMGSLSDEALLKKYKKSDSLGSHILAGIDDFEISYERGDTWRYKYSTESVPVKYKQSSKPIYARDIQQFYDLVVFKNENSKVIISHIENLLSKGYDLYQINWWINDLQRKGNLMELVHDRLKGKKLKKVSKFLDSKLMAFNGRQ